MPAERGPGVGDFAIDGQEIHAGGGAGPPRAPPRGRPVWAKVGPRIDGLLAASKAWTGGKQQLTATRLHELLSPKGIRSAPRCDALLSMLPAWMV